MPPLLVPANVLQFPPRFFEKFVLVIHCSASHSSTALICMIALNTKIVSLLFRGAVAISSGRGRTSPDVFNNSDDVLLPPLQVVIILNLKSTVNV